MKAVKGFYNPFAGSFPARECYDSAPPADRDERNEQRQADERASDRKTQVGTGDRSERIRTYNYPQSRVTDHRINLTLHKLDRIVEGEGLDELIDALIAEDQAARLAEAT